MNGVEKRKKQKKNPRILRTLGRALLAGVLFGIVAPAPPAEAREPSPDRALLRVELNSATVEELCLLPGIGPKKAAAIVAFRERRRFTRVTQLLRVRGIGRKTLRRLKPFVFVAPQTLKSGAPRASPVQRRR